MHIDPQLDLYFEREIDITPAQVFARWTTPDLLMPWFCPRPWQTVACEIDLRPGGVFSTTMQSPEGQRMPTMNACYLVVTPERLVWTNALKPGFQPIAPEQLVAAAAAGDFQLLVDLRFEPLPSGATRYRALARHATEASCQAHAAMGFAQGWGLALDQMVECVKAAHDPLGGLQLAK